MNKQSMYLEIKALRIQVAKLEKSMQQREDKLTNLLSLCEPFFKVVAPKIQEEILLNIWRGRWDK